jgi:hypothetical protein
VYRVADKAACRSRQKKTLEKSRDTKFTESALSDLTVFRSHAIGLFFLSL